MSLKFTEELCIMTKFEEELTCHFKIDFDLSTQMSQKFALGLLLTNGLLLTKVYYI